jgi:hypothetical protein
VADDKADNVEFETGDGVEAEMVQAEEREALPAAEEQTLARTRFLTSVKHVHIDTCAYSQLLPAPTLPSMESKQASNNKYAIVSFHVFCGQLIQFVVL